MQILNLADVKKIKDKNFHFVIYEEIPASNGPNGAKAASNSQK